MIRVSVDLDKCSTVLCSTESILSFISSHSPTHSHARACTQTSMLSVQIAMGEKLFSFVRSIDVELLKQTRQQLDQIIANMLEDLQV